MCFGRRGRGRPPIVAVLGWLALASPARSEDLSLLPPLLGTTQQQDSHAKAGLGLSGYDAVSYFLEAEPRSGDARQEIVWAGLAWRFASASDRAAFQRDPNSFAPRVGGYDAVAAAAGRAVEADPLLYVVAGGRLYMFRTAESRAAFLADPAAAEAAEQGWRALRGGLVQD